GRIAVHISYCQHHGIVAYVGTVEGVNIQSVACNSAGIGTSVVNITSGDGYGSRYGIQFHANLLARHNWRGDVFHGNNGGTAAAVAVHIGYGQDYVVVAHIGTIKGINVDANTCYPTLVRAAAVNIGGRNGGVSVCIQLDGDVLANRHRSFVVHYGDGKAASAA